jgi:phospholipase D1/2
MIDDADLENKNDNTQILSTYINLHSYNVDFSSEEIRMTCQCLRSLSYWSGGLNKTEQSILNGYYHLIENSKHYIYIENQFFISKSFTDDELDKKGRCVSNLIINEIALKLTDRIIKAHQNHEKFRVMIVIPLLPGFAGEVETSSTLQVILKFTYKSISRNKGLSMIEKLKELLDKNNPELFREYIGFFSLRNHAVIDNVPVTELIYIHSKLMIVDDRYVIMGSANINDRSMTGERDSEFAVIYSEDENSLKSMMNGKLYDSCAFAKSLRINIWREHLGIKDKNLIDDPLSDDVWKLITETAKKNTLVYRDLFNCYPDDTMIYFKDIPKNKNLTEEEKNILIEKYNKRKDEIVGHLVEFPYEFLKEEFLERSFFSAEMLVPIKNFV